MQYRVSDECRTTLPFTLIAFVEENEMSRYQIIDRQLVDAVDFSGMDPGAF